MIPDRKKRLGRGLEALLGMDAADQAYAAQTGEPVSNAQSSTGSADILFLNVYEIEDNPFQPRRDFSEPEIAALAESLKEHDMLQPVLVRQVEGRYQLIAGERRLRAAIKAGWSKIPARVRPADDRLVAELAIVENFHRKDLNAIEKALSFRRYLEQHQCTQEDLARRLKIDRSTLANLMRLLDLPSVVQEAVRSGTISAGHARTLLPLGEEAVQIEFAERIEREQWSVRHTELQVNLHIAREDEHPEQAVDGSADPQAGKKKAPNVQIEAIQQELKRALGVDIEIRCNRKGKGKLVLQFGSQRDFDRLLNLLMPSPTTQPTVGLQEVVGEAPVMRRVA